jgi:hypothetical protein
MERQTQNSEEINNDICENKDLNMDQIYSDKIIIRTFAAPFNTVKTYAVNTFWVVFHACSIYIMWVMLHYIASHLYIYFCTPTTIVGFLYSPFIISAPHCRALRWVIFNGSVSIDNMWIVFGTWLSSKLFIPKLTQHN